MKGYTMWPCMNGNNRDGGRDEWNAADGGMDRDDSRPDAYCRRRMGGIEGRGWVGRGVWSAVE